MRRRYNNYQDSKEKGFFSSSRKVGVFIFVVTVLQLIGILTFMHHFGLLE